MKYLRLIYQIPEFVLFYLYQLVRANLVIAYIILSPGVQIKPGFITVPLYLKTTGGIFLFSNLVSMTPGTLSIEIDDDRESILVHALIIEEKKKSLRELDELQKRIKRILG